MKVIAEDGLEAAKETLINAFLGYGLFRELVRDDSERWQLLKTVYQHWLQPNASTQLITASFGMEAVAVWHAPDHDWSISKDLPGDIPGMAQLNALMNIGAGYFKYYLREPAWHLSALGVQPEKQRQGFGLALVKEQLKRIDQSSPKPCFVDTHCRDNCHLYEKLGFKIVDRSFAPVGNIPYYPMIRNAQCWEATW